MNALGRKCYLKIKSSLFSWIWVLKCFFFSWVLPRLRLWRGPWFSWRNWQWLLLKTRFLVEEELATRHFFISLDAYFDLYNRFHTHQLFFRIWVQIFNTSEGLQKLISFPLHQAHLIWHFTFSSHFWGDETNIFFVLQTCVLICCKREQTFWQCWIACNF